MNVKEYTIGKILRGKQVGQLSVEAAIVVPIVMLVVASLIFMSFYAHDIVSIKSGMYDMAIDDTRGRNLYPKLFLMRTKAEKNKGKETTTIEISAWKKGSAGIFNSIAYPDDCKQLVIQKAMDTEILYVCRGAMDIVDKGDDK
jgi:hypothetical protein